MKHEFLGHFDTHAAVKSLHAAGLEDSVAEAIVNSISISRKTDLSNLVSKDDFFEFKDEVNEKFSFIDQRFNAVDKEIASLKHEIHDLRKDTKADMDSLKKDLIAQMATNKNDMLKWIFGLFIILMIAIFVKPHF